MAPASPDDERDRPLPFVDEHRVRVEATPERTWAAIVDLARRLTRPAPRAFAALWRLEPESGFAVAEDAPPRRLALRGRHRFARYELAFFVEDGPIGITLVARTLAAFPGVAGRAYRALIIGTGGHRFVVRRMLRQIARAAERGGLDGACRPSTRPDRDPSRPGRAPRGRGKTKTPSGSA